MPLKVVFHFEDTISFTQQLSSFLTIEVSSKKFKTKVHSQTFSIIRRKCQYFELPNSSKDKCKKKKKKTKKEKKKKLKCSSYFQHTDTVARI